LADICPYPDKLLKRPEEESNEPRKTITNVPIRVRRA
jgi:hypothetical protein